MKLLKFLVFFIAIFVSTNICAQKPILLCQKSSHDFGKIEEVKGPVKHEFIIKNIGKAPLVIDYCSSSCGCTEPTWTKTPILPGKTGTVVATFDPKDYNGVFTKTIWVYNNAAKKATTLVIRGDVIARKKK